MKYALVLLALFAAGLILSFTDLRCKDENRVRPRIPSYSWGEMGDIFAREKELDDELKGIQLYRTYQSASQDRLSTKRQSLQNAATILDAQARDNHPRLRDMLGDRYAAQSSVERMALHLLEQLETDGCPAEVIERLCCEMTTWSKTDPMLFRQPRQLKPR